MLASNYPNVTSSLEESYSKPNNYKLYQPLKDALDYSRINNDDYKHNLRQTLSKSKSKYIFDSNMKSFHPKEIQQIKRNLFIPINKELIPTKNVQKIRNIHFSIIDCQQKFGEAISQEQFQKRMMGRQLNKRTEIVYQLQEGNRLLSTSNVINQYNISDNRPISSYHEIHRQKVGMGQKSTFPQKIQSKELIFNQRDSQQYQSRGRIHTSYQPQLKDEVFQSRQTKYIKKQQPYRFKRQLLKYQTGTKQERLKNQKYNLFSMIDLGGNQDCNEKGCCGTNQIIASKLNRKHWY